MPKLALQKQLGRNTMKKTMVALTIVFTLLFNTISFASTNPSNTKSFALEDITEIIVTVIADNSLLKSVLVSTTNQL